MAYTASRRLSGLEASTSGRWYNDALSSRCVHLPSRPTGYQRSRTTHDSRHLVLTAARGPTQQQRMELPTAENAKIQTSKYVSSSVDLKGCPPQNYPEFAVIGRSNVGKSSLINMLTQNSKLAKVSKEPGELLHPRIRKEEMYSAVYASLLFRSSTHLKHGITDCSETEKDV